MQENSPKIAENLHARYTIYIPSIGTQVSLLTYVMHTYSR